MRQKIILFILVFLSAVECFSQGQTNIWYFGNNAGLDFSTGTPVALTDGQIVTNEGCATTSDANGNLLFYTDGITVWDRNHNIMPNGQFLQGDSSSSQSGIIVPFPNDVTKYYIFSVDQNASNGGLYYSVVDLTLNGGNGDIIPSRKNILLLARSAEKIAAISDDGDGYWVIGYASVTGNTSFYDTYHAYHITDSGISSGSVTSTHSGCGTGDGRGYLKVSPDGTKIAVCNQNQTHVCLHSFDDATGIVGAEIAQLNTQNSPYCAEFSANSEVMYTSSGQYSITTTYLHQFDLMATDINASRVQISSSVEQRASLQLAIDGKIYYARPGENYLGAVNDPEILGTGCNYVENAVDLGTGISTQGLPPFIQSLFLVGIEFEYTCLGDATEFLVTTNTENITSILWDFGDGTNSTLENPIHTYATPGSYDVTVTLNTATSTSSNMRTVIISNPPVMNTISDYVICDDVMNDGAAHFVLPTKEAEITAGQPAGDVLVLTYHTSLEDAENGTDPLADDYINVSNPETIYVKIAHQDNPDCYAINNFDLVVPESPTTETVNDVHVCDIANDGQEVVNLSQFTDQVLGTQSDTVFNVFYYEDATNAANDTDRLPTNYTLQAPSQTIFARKQNHSHTDCFVVIDFTLFTQTQYIANPVGDLIVCDDLSNDGTEIFNLAQQNPFISDGQTGSFSIKYYTSQSDADADSNQISNNFANEFNPQEIFVRIENDIEPNCYDTTSFFIEVKETPDVDIEEQIMYLCTGESITISADSGFDEYLWSTGQTTQEIMVTEAGLYTVEVITHYNSVPEISCSNTQTIRVIESDEAVITNVEVQDWTYNNNQIEIFVEGIGDYEYSVDGFSYQDSPIFTNLLPGNLTVFVRDKNGCGVVSEEVSLLFYPSFFTPNNDGFNDYWQIISAANEPDLKIHIFDRFGKLLTILKPESRGWDGTFHGRRLPSTDYWFMVERPSNNRKYTGHFTLKR